MFRSLLFNTLLSIAVIGGSYNYVIKPAIENQLSVLEASLDETKSHLVNLEDKNKELEEKLISFSSLRKRYESLKRENLRLESSLSQYANGTIKEKENSEIVKLHDYYMKRVGFSLTVDDTKAKRKPGLAHLDSKMRMFYNFYGTKRTFEIIDILGPIKSFTIQNYDGHCFPSSTITIQDGDYKVPPNGELNVIYMTDETNNSEIIIRKRNGKYTSKPSVMSEEAMKDLFKEYSVKYNDFYEKYDLANLIENYSFKVEINERS